MYWFFGALALVIVVMAVYFGGIKRFYDKIPWWDKTVHFLAGVLFSSFGARLAIVSGAGLSVFHAVAFGFTLAVTLHVVWELIEYFLDLKFCTNNQRWQQRYRHNFGTGEVKQSQLHMGANTPQPSGLADTVSDTVSCIAGAAATCAVMLLVL